MSWLDKTSFSPDAKNWSYSKFVKLFGEVNGDAAAKKFGVKKTKETPKGDKKKKEETDSEGD